VGEKEVLLYEHYPDTLDERKHGRRRFCGPTPDFLTVETEFSNLVMPVSKAHAFKKHGLHRSTSALRASSTKRRFF
jgi:hypothetical protein